jgi:acyl-coenzyme A thioesterase PaaI-like protein
MIQKNPPQRREGAKGTQRESWFSFSKSLRLCVLAVGVARYETGLARQAAPALGARLVRMGFNLHPAFRSTGGRVVHVAPDLRHIRVRLPLTWKTKNIVGSLYGGSLFAITDGAHPAMLMAALGEDYIIWDKAASIRYRKPGYTTLYADFRVTPEEMAGIRGALAKQHEVDWTFQIDIKDAEDVVHTVVERTVYIAEKNYYRQKSGGGDNS